MKTDDEEGVELLAMQTLTSQFEHQDVKMDKLITQIRPNIGMKL